MTPEQFERHVHNECLRILRALANKRYAGAGQRAAALAMLAEDQTLHRQAGEGFAAADPYDLKMLGVFFPEEDDRD